MTAARGTWTRDLSLPVNPWLVLLAVALCGGWLWPTHMIPWRSYHAEMAVVVVLLPVALWAPLRTRTPVVVPWIALVAFAAAAVPWVQYAAGVIDYIGDAWLACAYLVAFGLAIVTGARFEAVEPGRLAPVLFGSFALASLASTGLVLYQVLRLGGLGLLTLEFPYTPGARPFANLGQANHLATLLVWGLIAFWWLHLRGHARASVSAAAAALLLVGIAATQSRTAWVELGVLGLAAAVWHRPLASRRSWPGLVLLALLFAGLVVAWGRVSQAVDFGYVRTLGGELASAGLRPAAWRLFADAALREPWLGWGWNQMSVAQVAVALDHPPLHYTFVSSHNIVLDLAVQQGVPLTLLIGAAFLAWYAGAFRRVHTPERVLLLVAVSVLMAHALVEFPLSYTYFLLPAGLMMGLLHAGDAQARAVRVPRGSVAAVAAASAIVVGWMAVEYRMAEKSLEQVRMERNRVGFARGSVAPDLKMLTQLRAFLVFLRLRYAEPAAPEQLEAMRRHVAHAPSDGNFLALAIAEATNGRPDLASDALARMCRLVPAPRCTSALETWKAMAGHSPSFANVRLPR